MPHVPTDRCSTLHPSAIMWQTTDGRYAQLETIPHLSEDAVRARFDAQSWQRGRNRESYRQACGYLVTVRELYNRLDEYERWEQYLAGIREKYRTLRALKEEIAPAGLLD